MSIYFFILGKTFKVNLPGLIIIIFSLIKEFLYIIVNNYQGGSSWKEFGSTEYFGF